jgi:hypothetical protein
MIKNTLKYIYVKFSYLCKNDQVAISTIIAKPQCHMASQCPLHLRSHKHELVITLVI